MQKKEFNIGLIKGMQRDIDIAKPVSQDNCYAYENMNIRITPLSGEEAFAISNEKGTAKMDMAAYFIPEGGTILGSCALPDCVVYFMHFEDGTYDNKYQDITIDENSRDWIVKVSSVSSTNNTGTGIAEKLYVGNLGFNADYPIETLASVEAENIQKIYWVDGINQPRMINVKEDDLYGKKGRLAAAPASYFDFTRELPDALPSVSIEHRYSGGEFSGGSVQYALTFVNKYGAESAIWYQSPTYYTGFADRACSGEEKCSNSFAIKFNVQVSSTTHVYSSYVDLIGSTKLLTAYQDTKFQYFDFIRVYSIRRTALNGTPEVWQVHDVPISDMQSTYTFVDSGTEGSIIDETELLYKNGKAITASTITQKDGTLFLGNIKELNKTDCSNYALSCADNTYVSSTDDTLKVYLYDSDVDETASGKYKQPAFMPKCNYCIGMQFMDKYGRWSDVITDSVSSFSLSDDTALTKVDVYNVSVGNSDTSTTYYYMSDVSKWTQAADSNAYVKITTNEDGISITASSDNNGTITEKGYYIAHRNAAINAVFSTGAEITMPAPVFRPQRIVIRQNDFNTRNILCQGFVQPAMQVKGESEGTPDYQPSWFVRNIYYEPLTNQSAQYFDDTTYGNYGSLSATSSNHKYTTAPLNFPVWAGRVPTPGDYYLHDDTYYYTSCNHELCVPFGIDATWNSSSGSYSTSYETYFDTSHNVMTLHSADIEFNPDFASLDLSDVSYRRIGYWKFDSCKSDFRMTLKDTPAYASMQGPLNISEDTRIMCGPLYADLIVRFTGKKQYYIDSTDETSDDPVVKSQTQFMVYPWQHTGSLTNATETSLGGTLDTKLITTFSNYTYTAYTDDELASTSVSLNSKFSLDDIWASVKCRYIPSVAGVSYSLQNSVMGDVIYQGSVSRTLTTLNYYPSAFAYNYGYKASHAIESFSEYLQDSHITVPGTDITEESYTDSDYSSTSSINYQTLLTSAQYLKKMSDDDADYPKKVSVTNKAISMKYKTPPHVVMSYYRYNSSITTLAGIKLSTPQEAQAIGSSTTSKETNGYIPVVYLKHTATANQNAFMASSAAVVPLLAAVSNGIKVPKAQWGDAWLCPYECIKCYPYTSSDENQILDVATGDLFSYINTYGRYDVNCNGLFNVALTPDSCNLINTVYSQTNNYFQYSTQETDYELIDDYPNYITWTLTKNSTATPDAWTHVTLASSLELDGNRGPVNKLQRLNDNILCFQDTGISQILYNQNTALSTESGIPVELGNSGKVQGKRYISNTIGTTNKWSVIEGSLGVYFQDSSSNGLYLVNGEGLQDLTQAKGFSYWASDIMDSQQAWNPSVDNKGVFKSFYDIQQGEVYFASHAGDDSVCLAWNENLKEFTSFYSYGNLTTMEQLKGHILVTDDCTFHLLHEGAYNSLLGTACPYWSVISVNPQPVGDKVFSNVTLHMDMINGNPAVASDGYLYNDGTAAVTYDDSGNVSGIEPYNVDAKLLSRRGHVSAADNGIKTANIPFSTLAVFNEYQNTGNVELYDKEYGYSYNRGFAKQRFRTWRVQVPRNAGKLFTGDRIRSPWAYVKLSKETPVEGYHAILHNMSVTYYE